jgi:multiple sugar transport system ATP-binding protein
MASVTFSHVTKVFDDNVVAVSDLNIHIEDKEFLVIVGPSGCGKTTSLRLLAGLEEVTDGDIYIGDRRVNDVSPKDRDIAMVFQSYALYPHMSVYDNAAFGLKLRRYAREEIDHRVKNASDRLGLLDLLDRKPQALSGGQRQRVAVGRAIVRDPAVFLMDEPLSNLDAKLRVESRAMIKLLHQRLETTFVYVTHDQVEAMTMGQRIAVLKDGVLQQIDEPQTLYDEPRNVFVAGFIGSPAMNFFPATVRRQNGELCIDVGDFQLAVPLERREAWSKVEGQDVIMGIRPEDLHDPDLLPPEVMANQVEAEVGFIELLGSEKDLFLRAGKNEFFARVDPRSGIKADSTVEIAFDITNIHLFDAETEEAIR